ncbi:hypothetical protein KIPB_005977 [Kipferlia bialata]|uniref:Uncharacterized protein n=1 Tax=Kipferlia bialata TaxID=797122 RepID=A0A9K3CWJ0_9EUKA|nr:hypothetical protein KIPB_005977 [Kipferlia bialata]|eukprot:g5977.t1
MTVESGFGVCLCTLVLLPALGVATYERQHLRSAVVFVTLGSALLNAPLMLMGSMGPSVSGLSTAVLCCCFVAMAVLTHFLSYCRYILSVSVSRQKRHALASCLTLVCVCGGLFALAPASLSTHTYPGHSATMSMVVVCLLLLGLGALTFLLPKDRPGLVTWRRSLTAAARNAHTHVFRGLKVGKRLAGRGMVNRSLRYGAVCGCLKALVCVLPQLLAAHPSVVSDNLMHTGALCLLCTAVGLAVGIAIMFVAYGCVRHSKQSSIKKGRTQPRSLRGSRKGRGRGGEGAGVGLSLCLLALASALFIYSVFHEESLLLSSTCILCIAMGCLLGTFSFASTDVMVESLRVLHVPLAVMSVLTDTGTTCTMAAVLLVLHIAGGGTTVMLLSLFALCFVLALGCWFDLYNFGGSDREREKMVERESKGYRAMRSPASGTPRSRAYSRDSAPPSPMPGSERVAFRGSRDSISVSVGGGTRSLLGDGDDHSTPSAHAGVLG